MIKNRDRKINHDLRTIVVDSEKEDLYNSGEGYIISSEEEDTISQNNHKNTESKDVNFDIMEIKFNQHCDDLLERMTIDYRAQRNELKKLKIRYHQDIRKAKRVKVKKKNKKPTGFTKSEPIPDGLAKLIGVENGTVMPRTQVTKKVYSYIRENELYLKKNKRVLRANKEILEVFNLPESVNISVKEHDPNGFNFFNIQTHISKCYENNR